MEYNGLSSKEAEKILEKAGLNEIKEKKPGIVKKFLTWFISPIALMLSSAAVLSLLIGHFFDSYFIIILMAVNFFVSFWQEKKADNAIKKISEKIAIDTRTLRDGQWQYVNSKKIVPGDIIEIISGDIIPADIEIINEKNLSVNESVLTGESLPKEKRQKGDCYSGSFAATGWAIARVKSTGKNTYFGKILTSIDKDCKKSILEKDILSIAKLLSFLSIISVIILSIFFIVQGKSIIELITLDLSLIIAGIPISLPTVMTLIISLGVIVLAKKNAIIRRLSSLEDLANVNLLLSDKTGTLTRNIISVKKIIAYNNFQEKDVIAFAFFSTSGNDRSSIDKAIIRKNERLNLTLDYKMIDFTPVDSERKRSTVLINFEGKELLISAGAVQVIEKFCLIDKEMKKKLEEDITISAQDGYRVIAVAINNIEKREEKMTLAGLLLLSDSLVEDAKETIDFIKSNGIKVKILTGDNITIAKRIAQDLGIEGDVVNKRSLPNNSFNNLSDNDLERISVFAEITPLDKYNLVAAMEKRYIVAVTGDGINDLPAIKKANVGIAVNNAVDALKGSADIILMSDGISVIKNAIIEARKVFARLYTYSLYRISESFRVIITIVLIGIFYNTYPLTPIHLILLALLNDIPIIALAFNRVKTTNKPAEVNAKNRLRLSVLFGSVGIINSLLLFIIVKNILNLDWGMIQTIFFLKLAISGHLLIYVAHTEERWYKYLPSIRVISAIFITQLIATLFAFSGIFVSRISLYWIIFIWLWALAWMQVSERMKDLSKIFSRA